MRFSHIPLSLVTATVVLTGGVSSSFQDGFLGGSAIATAQPAPTSTQPTITAEVQPFTLTGQLDSQSTRSDQGGYFNTHSFEGIAGQSVVIEMDSTQFDSVLALQDPSGQKIAENDDSPGGTNSRIVITLPTTGRYTPVARSYSADGTGSYTLSLKAASPTDFAEERLRQRAGEGTTLNNIGLVYDNLGKHPQAYASDDNISWEALGLAPVLQFQEIQPQIKATLIANDPLVPSRPFKAYIKRRDIDLPGYELFSTFLHLRSNEYIC